MNRAGNNLFNSLFARVALLVLAGLSLISVSVSYVVLSASKDLFTDTYGASQEKVFNQIENELNDFHDDIGEVMTAIDSSWAFRLFLSGEEEMDNLQNFQNIYQMEADLEEGKSSDMETLNILVIGKNGRRYLSRTETISMENKDIRASDPVIRAIEEPEIIHYQHSHGAYTATAKDRDVVVVSKALYYQENKEVYAVVLLTLTQDMMQKYYDYFLTDYSSFYMVDQNGTVLCSDDTDSIGKKLDTSWSTEAEATDRQRFISDNDITVLKRHLTYQNCTIYGTIDNQKALGGLYNMPLLITMCTVISALVLLLVLFLTRKTTAPLARLSRKMSKVREGDFMEYMPVEGTTEVRELAITYNYMLDDIKNYIDELMNTQQEKRGAEIKALQMQINPHYIYNTLASIKWMVYSNDREKTIKMIDAFISLLRNTISNADEYITIDKEVENLHNYILINQIRYGDAVKVGFDVAESSRDCMIPKMILQPFVENAFFHAFPSGRKGNINIIMDASDKELDITIKDDGIGMDQSKVNKVIREDTKKEHFSGIGINNVRERIELIYGERSSLRMDSREGEGTTVHIVLPADHISSKEDDEQ